MQYIPVCEKDSKMDQSKNLPYVYWNVLLLVDSIRLRGLRMLCMYSMINIHRLSRLSGCREVEKLSMQSQHRHKHRGTYSLECGEGG